MYIPIIMAAAVVASATLPPHQQQRLDAELRGVETVTMIPRRGAMSEVTPGPTSTVYGYQAYWDDDLYTVSWDSLSHIALFQADAEADGSLSSTSHWDEAEVAVALAAPYGVKVHLCVTNFSSSEISSIVESPDNRARLISNLESWVLKTGADGVNIDFEGLSSSSKTAMVTFTKELQAVFGDEVVLATPAVDWSGAWDYSELSKYADLFIMGYAYHYTGGSPGPNDPLLSSGTWGTYSLEWTVNDYITNGADPNRVILGLPLYGQEWTTYSASIGASAVGNGWSVFWAEANERAQTYGRKYDIASDTPWYYDGADQGWYGDIDSLSLRIEFALAEDLSGIGFWALHYDDDDPELWSQIYDLTTEKTAGTGDTAEPYDTADTGDGTVIVTEDGSLSADVAPPQLAYVGDTVRLIGSATGEGAAQAQYGWTQLSGPPADLNNSDSSHPTFTALEPGSASFELTVSSGGSYGEPAVAWVVVVDKAFGDDGSRCGCSNSSNVGWFLFWLVVPLVLFRRRGVSES